MPFVQKFCYVGDIVSSDCGDACAVDARIESAVCGQSVRRAAQVHLRLE
jgi:hypothetical protein